MRRVTMIGVYEFVFQPNVSLVDAESSLHLALFAVEGIAGQVQVHMDARYHVDEDGHAIFIDGTTRVGKLISRVFAGLLIRELGEDAFSAHQIAEFPHHVNQRRSVSA